MKKSLQKLSVAVLLLIGAAGASATPITWTDTTGLSPDAYTLESIYQDGIQDGLIPLTGHESLIQLLEDPSWLSFIEKQCSWWNTKCHERTVPEPGALGLIAAGIVIVGMAIRRTRRLRAGFGTRIQES